MKVFGVFGDFNAIRTSSERRGVLGASRDVGRGCHAIFVTLFQI